MNEVFLWNVPSGENADDTFGPWIEDNKIKALFIEPVFISGYPEKWKVIEAHIGTLLEREFLADPGSVQVFIVQE